VEAEAVRMDATLHALADPTRRTVLRLVRDRELAAGEIAREFPGMSRPAVSQHLRVLARAGLVVDRAAGTLRLYRLRREALSDVTAFLDEMWSDRVTALTAAGRDEWPARARAGLRQPQGFGLRQPHGSGE
jgi:DNA-binding transcriptional ArsR family regulator